MRHTLLLLAVAGLGMWSLLRPDDSSAVHPSGSLGGAIAEEHDASSGITSGLRSRPTISSTTPPASADKADDDEWDDRYPPLTPTDLLDPARVAELEAAGKTLRARGVVRRPMGVPEHVLTHYDSVRWPKDARYFDADQLNDTNVSTLTADLRTCMEAIHERSGATALGCSFKVFVNAVADGHEVVVREIEVPAWPTTFEEADRRCFQAAYRRAAAPTLMTYDVWILSEPCFELGPGHRRTD